MNPIVDAGDERVDVDIVLVADRQRRSGSPGSGRRRRSAASARGRERRGSPWCRPRRSADDGRERASLARAPRMPSTTATASDSEARFDCEQRAFEDRRAVALQVKHGPARRDDPRLLPTARRRGRRRTGSPHQPPRARPRSRPVGARLSSWARPRRRSRKYFCRSCPRCRSARMAAIALFSCSRRSVSCLRTAMPAPWPNQLGSVSGGPTNSKSLPRSVLRKPAHRQRIGQEQRRPGRDEIEIGLVLGAVADDLDRVAEVVGQEPVMDGRALHADLLALQASGVTSMPEPFLAANGAGVW